MNNASRHTVLSNLAIIVADSLDQYGVNGRAVVEGAGIDFEHALDPDTRIPLTVARTMWDRAASASGDPCFGLLVASRFNPSLLHGLGFSWMASGTLAEAFARMLRFQKLINSAANFTTEEDAGEICYIAGLTLPGETHHPVYGLSLLAGVVRLCRLTAGQEVSPARVTFTGSPPPCADRIEAFFDCPVLFNREQSSLCFRRDVLEKPVLAANPRVARINDQVVIEYLERVGRGSLESRVKEKILERLPSGRPGQAEIAAELNMSLRNLQRKLQAEGTSFRDLLEEIRKDLAIRFIRDSQRPIGAISYSLGYSEPANFTRSFRGWTGISPRRYREKMRGEGASTSTGSA